ncbi:hypothetical protein QO001_001646 [Methylobacterium brachiatum]|uniref:Uncharacterized protein n=1 Tax=Methylobacterium brachiatum TaxID=269660 RepID=A0AAJ1WWZ9_9HYPH|nr:hypothetical protein [Methylobacterium brachiatum]
MPIYSEPDTGFAQAAIVGRFEAGPAAIRVEA